jgi:Protein of unknown function (DUF3224)
MKRIHRSLALLVVAAGMAAAEPAGVAAKAAPEVCLANTAVPEGFQRATGSFEVTMSSPPPYDSADGVDLGRTTGHKQFHGGLEATSEVEMLGARTAVKGSAAYVAIERVVGSLAGRHGSFVLQHSGTMTRGALQSTIAVVPDSGTGELKGIAGTMTIEVVEGKHLFTFDYRLGTP